MIQFDEANFSRRAPLPDDWLETCKWLGDRPMGAGADGFLPIRYKSRDEFFNLTDKHALNHYTIEGRQIFFGGPPDATEGVTFKIVYYGEVPTFSDTRPSWVYTKYPSLYRYAALMHADLHAVGEEDKAAMLKAAVDEQIDKLNAVHRYAKASGSRLTRTRTRSFG